MFQVTTVNITLITIYNIIKKLFKVKSYYYMFELQTLIKNEYSFTLSFYFFLI